LKRVCRKKLRCCWRRKVCYLPQSRIFILPKPSKQIFPNHKRTKRDGNNTPRNEQPKRKPSQKYFVPYKPISNSEFFVCELPRWINVLFKTAFLCHTDNSENSIHYFLEKFFLSMSKKHKKRIIIALIVIALLLLWGEMGVGLFGSPIAGD